MKRKIGIHRVFTFAGGVILLLSGILAFSWIAEPATLADYYAHINNPANGLVRERALGGVTYRAICQPRELIAYREFCAQRQSDAGLLDSIEQSFESTLAFQLQFLPDSSIASGDVMYKDITSYEEYAARVRTLNFDMRELVQLHVGSAVFVPDICFAENTYSISTGRKVLIFFTAVPTGRELYSNESVDLVFNDEVFGGGIQRYRFETDALSSIPEFPLADALKRSVQ